MLTFIMILLIIMLLCWLCSWS